MADPMERPDEELKPLGASRAVAPLAWEDGGGFSYPGLMRIRTLPDPGALIHAVLNGFFVPYRTMQLPGVPLPVDRREMVNSYRTYLSESLSKPIEEANQYGDTVYDSLARGKMRYYATRIRDYHIDVMRSELRDPDFFLDDKYLELLANFTGKDIYVLNNLTRDVHYFDHSDIDMYYMGRPTIIILFLPGPDHYELVGVYADDGELYTCFDTNAPVVQALRARYMELHEAAKAAEAAKARAQYGY